MKTVFVVILSLFFASSALCQEKKTEFFDTKYDDKADPVAQLDVAKAVATAEGKLILLDIGGEWCIWCHRLDDFFRSNEDVATVLMKHYVPVKINYSLENKNESFLAQFPKVAGYPHLFVLDAEGTLIHSQDTGELEEGKGHSREKVMAFLKEWAEKEHKGNL